MSMRTLVVRPDLPDEFQGLRNVAMNLWHSWNPEVVRLFQTLDPDLWEEVKHNPVQLLNRLSDTRKREVLGDATLMARIAQVEDAFEDYVNSQTVYEYNLERPIDYRIAYFSMEYGLHECLPIYSGGLGLLAGDHLKSASNLSLPLIAVGLLYQKGYFKQYLNIDGWQQELYPDNDFHNLPISPVPDGNGGHAGFDLDMAGETVRVLIWRIQVGRIPLFLLDTNHPDNSEYARSITAELYGGDLETRMRQEIVLGIGGARALHLLGFWPYVYHLNEGHAAFAALERISQTIKTYRVEADAALRAVAASTVFTTHTPVPAGIDLFPPHLVEKYFSNYMRSLGMTTQELFDLGRQNPADHQSPLSMAVFALNVSRGVNAVSRLHSTVSRKMWSSLWSGMDEQDVPIGYVTNGVHIPSYVSKEMADLFARYLGKGWIEEPDNEKVWSRAHTIPHEELWSVHETRRERLVAFCRRRILKQVMAGGGTTLDVRRSFEVLNPEALTIGFARRFAPYKRAGLLFTDMDRFAQIVSDKDRPVQFIFAGKAHPKDHLGKELIKMVVSHARSEQFRRNVVFLEDYDINIARYLVQGVDVWLNNPRRPMEACGTSGMKAAANGALNVSILDGWWPEAYNGENGWAIGKGEELEDREYQDRMEARSLYDILLSEVIPLFFDRGPDGLPHEWIKMMKNSLATVCRQFNSHRMLEQYMEQYYQPAGLAHSILSENRLARARELSEWKTKIRSMWHQVRVVDVQEQRHDQLSLGERLTVTAFVHLGSLEEQEVVVDLCHGPVDAGTDKMTDRHLIPMTSSGNESNGVWRFEGTIPCDETGVYGYQVRVLPFHPYLLNPLSLNLVTWS